MKATLSIKRRLMLLLVALLWVLAPLGMRLASRTIVSASNEPKVVAVNWNSSPESLAPETSW